MDPSELLDCRKGDLRTPEDLSRYFRDEVMAQVEVLHAVGSLDLGGFHPNQVL